MRTEEEILKERLRYLREAKRIGENEHSFYCNKYLKCFRNDILPTEFQALADISESQLQSHIDRIERDLEDARANEFRIE
ncbi:MAG: hypothetical protein A07HR67_02392 [uncultured archaeon A07HR67]|jgi:hypothetical protein|nr:MAG: hypothetical protein A07HR67_02392 [uncultured archaeon A07HR67]